MSRSREAGEGSASYSPVWRALGSGHTKYESSVEELMAFQVPERCCSLKSSEEGKKKDKISLEK